jgi:hypothetical protein
MTKRGIFIPAEMMTSIPDPETESREGEKFLPN